VPVIASLASIGHLLTLYFIWRIFGRGHGVVGIVIVVVIALVLSLLSMLWRRRGGGGFFRRTGW
jgi:hypothetical protein